MRKALAIGLLGIMPYVAAAEQVEHVDPQLVERCIAAPDIEGDICESEAVLRAVVLRLGREMYDISMHVGYEIAPEDMCLLSCDHGGMWEDCLLDAKRTLVHYTMIVKQHPTFARMYRLEEKLPVLEQKLQAVEDHLKKHSAE